MTIENERVAIGDNSGDLAAQIAAAFSPIRLADDHAALALEVGALAAESKLLITVNDPVTSERAADLVVRLRALVKRVDDKAGEVALPVRLAYKNTLDFFNGLNNSDLKRAGVLTLEKSRLERSIATHAFSVAQKQQRLAREAANKERARLAEEHAAAAAREAAAQPIAAETLLTAALKTEAVAQQLEARAEGPIQDLARQRTDSGVVGLRGLPTFEVVDGQLLRATLGHLADHFDQEALRKALRSFMAAQIKAERMKSADEVIDGRRAFISDPAIPGVDFFTDYKGSVRA